MGNFLNSLMLAVINFFFPPASPTHPATATPAPAVQTTQPQTEQEIDAINNYHGGEIGESLAPYLIYLDEGFPDIYNPAHLKNVHYYAFYFSASWCPPCRAFTPKLIEFYNRFKRTHPNFELIFVCEDQSQQDMQNYMIDDAMPWPAIRYDAIHTPAVNLDVKYGAQVLPDLVLTDSDGRILSDTIVNGRDRGPDNVIDDISSMVPRPTQ